MNNSLQSMIIRVLGYFLKDAGVLAMTFSFEGQGKIFRISTAKSLIQVAKILEIVLECTSNLLAITTNSSARRSLISTARNSSSYVKRLFHPSFSLDV